MPGIEGFYAGVRHPLTAPDQVLALLATGLLLGGFPLPRLAPAFAALAAGLLGGLLLGNAAASPSPWLYAIAATSAAMAALAPGRWRAAAVVAAGTAGFLLGWASIPDPGPPQDRRVTMAGSAAAGFLVTLYLAGTLDLLCERLAHPVLRIALRVVAAWIAAISVLMLALALAPPTALD